VSVIPVDALIKFYPDKFCFEFKPSKKKSDEDDEDEAGNAIINRGSRNPDKDIDNNQDISPNDQRSSGEAVPLNIEEP
jgi:hypothetical protein